MPVDTADVAYLRSINGTCTRQGCGEVASGTHDYPTICWQHLAGPVAQPVVTTGKEA